MATRAIGITSRFDRVSSAYVASPPAVAMPEPNDLSRPSARRAQTTSEECYEITNIILPADLEIKHVPE